MLIECYINKSHFILHGRQSQRFFITCFWPIKSYSEQMVHIITWHLTVETCSRFLIFSRRLEGAVSRADKSQHSNPKPYYTFFRFLANFLLHRQPSKTCELRVSCRVWDSRVLKVQCSTRIADLSFRLQTTIRLTLFFCCSIQ